MDLSVLTPKPNQSAFIHYSNANHERVKEENPDASIGDVVSIAWLRGRRWASAR